MSEGLTTTFDLLSATRNEAAVPVLVLALDSHHERIRADALRTLLDRRSLVGQREILRRLHKLDRNSRELIGEKPGGLSQGLRDAVLPGEDQLVSNGCRVALWHREYDLVPTLINALEKGSNSQAEEIGRTLIELMRLLYSELDGRRDTKRRRDPELVRQRVEESLEQSVQRFSQHGRVEPIEALLRIAPRHNATLRKILGDPHHGTYLALVAAAQHSQHVGAMRLLLSFLDDAHPPLAVLNIVEHRSDESFLTLLFEKFGGRLSPSIEKNLKRLSAIRWVQDEDKSVLTKLDDESQAEAVRFVMLSGTKRLEAFPTIAFVLESGKDAGRRAASAALAEFPGGAANKAALAALDDPDPEVQANIIKQLRPRGMPGALQHLIDRLDSPHELVREAARENLPEFTFARFLSAFDVLDEVVRVRTGALVRKADPQAVPELEKEMQSPARTRRIRALAVAASLGVVAELEEHVIALVSDEDHLVRVEAATALAQCPTVAAQEALREALTDNSFAVQQAAEESLRELGQTAVPPIAPSGGAGSLHDTWPTEELEA